MIPTINSNPKKMLDGILIEKKETKVNQ